MKRDTLTNLRKPDSELDDTAYKRVTEENSVRMMDTVSSINLTESLN